MATPSRPSFTNLYCALAGAMALGIVLHTLLSRAPRAQETLDAMALVMETWDESLASSPDDLPLPTEWRAAEGPYMLVTEDSMHLCRRLPSGSWVSIDLERAIERLKLPVAQAPRLA